MDRRAAASTRRAARRWAARRSINGHIYNRGQRQDFDTWAQLGNRGWGYADVLPYFKRLERRVGEGDDDLSRPRRQPDRHRPWTGSDPLCEAFIEGAVSLGIPRNPDYNGAIQEGVVLRPAHHRQRPARQRRHRLPASGAQAAECRRAHARACHQHHVRGQARGRRALHQGRQGRHAGRGARQQGGDPVRRHL